MGNKKHAKIFPPLINDMEKCRKRREKIHTQHHTQFQLITIGDFLFITYYIHTHTHFIFSALKFNIRFAISNFSSAASENDNDDGVFFS